MGQVRIVKIETEVDQKKNKLVILFFFRLRNF